MTNTNLWYIADVTVGLYLCHYTSALSYEDSARMLALIRADRAFNSASLAS